VPSILKDLGISSIRLITNNPNKVQRLTSLGLQVDGTIPIVVSEATPYNRHYLETKQERMAHTNFGEMLARSPESFSTTSQNDETR
jgi:3,4-dihydroxy 2-butanone 4-phosphate synthase/GTP cyclohydrolase II